MPRTSRGSGTNTGYNYDVYGSFYDPTNKPRPFTRRTTSRDSVRNAFERNVRGSGQDFSDLFTTEEEMRKYLGTLGRDLATTRSEIYQGIEEAEARDPNVPVEVAEAKKRGAGIEGQKTLAKAETELSMYKDQRDFAARSFLEDLKLNYAQLDLAKQQMELQKEAQEDANKWNVLGLLTTGVATVLGGPIGGGLWNLLFNAGVSGAGLAGTSVLGTPGQNYNSTLSLPNYMTDPRYADRNGVGFNPNR